MNKKHSSQYQRKDLILHIDVISKFEQIAKNSKKSVKKSMEDALGEYQEADVRFIRIKSNPLISVAEAEEGMLHLLNSSGMKAVKNLFMGSNQGENVPECDATDAPSE